MTARLMVHRPGNAPEEIALDGPATAGGGPDDAVRLEGAPAAAMSLNPSPAGVVVAIRLAGAVLRGGRRRSALALRAGRARLLRPGERLEIQGVALEIPCAAEAAGTRLLACALLRDAAAGDEAVAGPHLLALEGRDAGRRFPLGGDGVVGRGRTAAARLSDRRASRRHARVARDDAGYSVEDLGSKNGVRVNGSRIGPGPSPLLAGDEIGIGETALALVDPDGAAGLPRKLVADGSLPPGPTRGGSRAAALAAAALLAGAAVLALEALRG